MKHTLMLVLAVVVGVFVYDYVIKGKLKLVA